MTPIRGRQTPPVELNGDGRRLLESRVRGRRAARPFERGGTDMSDGKFLRKRGRVNP